MEDKLFRNFMAKEKLASLDDETIDELIKMIKTADIVVHLAELVAMIKTADIGEVNVYNLLKAVKEKFPKVVEGFEDLI